MTIAERGSGMRSFLVLLWIFWANMLFIFGITTIYFLRIQYWGAFVSGPLLLLVLYAGWKLLGKTRHDWNMVR